MEVTLFSIGSEGEYWWRQFVGPSLNGVVFVATAETNIAIKINTQNVLQNEGVRFPRSQ